MKEKIEWYQEVLELEPSSKVFFPLARLLAESGQLEKAVLTLRQGLERHPEFMEARLYFIDLLFRTGQVELCQRQVRHISPMLAKYAGFWQAWGHTLSLTDEDSDANLAVAFLAASFQQSGLTLAQVLERGLRGVINDVRADVRADARIATQKVPGEAAVKPPAPVVPSPVPPVTPVTDVPPIAPVPPVPSGPTQLVDRIADDYGDDMEERFSIRTRSMADVLAEQGDYSGAIEIYKELLAQATHPDEIADIHYRIVTLTNCLDASEQPQSVEFAMPVTQAAPVSSRHKVLSVLEALAERLESRVHA